MSVKTRATIEDLYKVEGKAELVNWEIVLMSPTGGIPAPAGGGLYASLLQHERLQGHGYTFPDNVGFIVKLPHRESFSPDAAGISVRCREAIFLTVLPIFAVEVRSKNDYGPAAEDALKEKRADYFTCGTLVVWDVDVLREHDPGIPRKRSR